MPKKLVHVKAYDRSKPHKKKHGAKKHKAKSKSKASAMPPQLRRSSRLKQ